MKTNAAATLLPQVLLVDDDAPLCELMAMRLESKGYHVSIEHTAAGCLDHLSRAPVDTVVLDLRLGNDDGLEVLARIQERARDVPVIMLTAHGTIETAVQAMQRGAYGFLTKPFEDHEILQKLAHAVERSALRREVAHLRQMVGAETEDGLLVGASDAITHVRSIITRIAPTDATVMVTGESGTGKELAARSLHALSPRRDARFVAINCGAIPAELLESELFGHVKGAFTGAMRDREGLFGAARGGTLFLDEIGEASPGVQVKLLRALQERRITRVGSASEEEIDVRIIAATNRDLREEVVEKRFREDLFYRLHVVPLHMPPLRERPEDIPLLAELFLDRAAARYKMRAPTLARDAIETLVGYRWPGNVRELIHELEAALLLARTDELRAVHLSQQVRTKRPASDAAQPITTSLPAQDQSLPPLKEARDAFERAYLTEALRRSAGNVSAAARLAGRNRSDFYDLMRRHGLSPGDFKENGQSQESGHS